MAQLDKVLTKAAEQVWASPDGKMTIFQVTLEYEGKDFKAKTYSKAVATVGWSGTIESYEKPGRNGAETFVKQPQKEGGWQGGGGGGGSKPQGDQFTMYESYAKDLAIACVISTAKGVVFDSSTYEELLEAVAGGGEQLFAAHSNAGKETAEIAQTANKVFSDGTPVPTEPTITDDDIDNAELPL